MGGDNRLVCGGRVPTTLAAFDQVAKERTPPNCAAALHELAEYQGPSENEATIAALTILFEGAIARETRTPCREIGLSRSIGSTGRRRYVTWMN